MGAVAAGLMGAQAVGSIYGGVAQARAQRAQANYQNEMFVLNAKFAELKGKDALRRGDKEAADALKAGKQVIGSQRAAIAAQGIEVDSGSALDIQADTATQARLNAMQIKNNAWREAWGYKVEAANNIAQGRYAQISGTAAARQTLITAGAQAVGYGVKAYQGFKENPNSSSSSQKEGTP